MIYKLLYIPYDDTQITPSVDYNYWLKRLDTQLIEPTNQVPKNVRPKNKKREYKTLETSVLNSLMFPPFLVISQKVL